jgi:hypothetical protein
MCGWLRQSVLCVLALQNIKYVGAIAELQGTGHTRSELFVCVAVEAYNAAARVWLQTIAPYKAVLWWYW